MEDPNRIRTLLGKYAEDTATESEQQELFALITHANDDELESSLTAFLQTIQPHYDETRRQRILDAILQQVNALKPAEDKQRVIPMRKPWIKWIAAASIIIIAAVSYFVISKRSEKSPDYANAPQQQRYKNDIAPAHDGVVLTLADGSQVVLDNISNGTVTSQGASQLSKQDSTLSYRSLTTDHSPLTVYNTVATQKGRTFHLQLADGTDVWLNSESSLKYPTAFNGATREVEITGEAYFEVKHNAKQPFKVHLPNGSVVEDIGTSFNINSYTDESDIKTTLIEGSVKVLSPAVSGMSPSGGGARRAGEDKGGRPGVDNGVILKPNQQAVFNPSIRVIRVQNDVDLEEILAWKNGRFQFNGSSVEDIMNQLKRWYDIDVEYKDKITETFVAKISRDLPVSKLLALLEMTKQVKFVVDGNKIIVMKY